MKSKRLAAFAAALTLSAASAFARVTSAKSLVKNLSDLIDDISDTVLLVVEGLIGLSAGILLFLAWIESSGDQPNAKTRYVKWGGGLLAALIGIELVKYMF